MAEERAEGGGGRGGVRGESTKNRATENVKPNEQRKRGFNMTPCEVAK